MKTIYIANGKCWVQFCFCVEVVFVACSLWTIFGIRGLLPQPIHLKCTSALVTAVELNVIGLFMVRNRLHALRG